jgi:hypothetical protein
MKNKDFENFEDGDFEDEIDQEEFKRISRLALEKTRKLVQSHIAKNQDNRIKTIGDKVLVWDCSRLTDVSTGEIDYDTSVHRTLSENASIVIEDRNKYVAQLTTFAGDFSKNLDLIIWNKKLNKKFRTSSEFVKLV